MVTFAEPVQTGLYTWLLAWTSDQVSPTFRVYRDGVLLSEQTAAEYELSVTGGEVPVIEVLDDASANPQSSFPNGLTLGWRTDPESATYRVDRWTGADWLEVDTLAASDGGWQSYSTGVLADGATHLWRVVPIDSAGNSGTPLEFSALMVRHPDPPDVDYAYESVGRTVTVSAAG